MAKPEIYDLIEFSYKYRTDEEVPLEYYFIETEKGM